MTAGTVAPSRLTTIRDVAHTTLSGDLPRDPPARLGDFRDVGRRIHLRKNHQRNRVLGVDRHIELCEQLGKAGADVFFQLSRQAAAGAVE